MSTPAPIARRLIVRGRVQGVFYRGWTVERARAAGITGWVRNRPDGTVEIHAEGAAAVIESLVAACHDGPPAARVTAVEVGDVSREDAVGFVQRATG